MKYLLVGIVIYFLVSRILRIGAAVKQDSAKNNAKPNTKRDQPKDNHGGEYVDYEEIE